MKPNKERVVEPPNSLFDNPHAPTVTKRDAGKNFIKHDFDEEEFDIPLFKATEMKVKRGKNAQTIFCNDGDGGKRVPVYEHVPHTTQQMICTVHKTIYI